MTKEPIPTLVATLLQKLRIPFIKEELFMQIKGHPSYPGLHAITGVLTHFNLENIAAVVPAEAASMPHLPKSFLAELNDEFHVVTQHKNRVEVMNASLQSTQMELPAFLDQFTGVIVAVDQGEATAYTNSISNRYTWPLIALLAIASLALIQFNPGQLIFFVLSLAGLVLSHAIWKQESGESSSLGDAFCGASDQQKDCGAVLNSKGARLFQKYKISDLSMVYFATLTLLSLSLGLMSISLSPLHYGSILALPVTLYSIYYQALVVKKWCMLCLGIVAVLWLQAALAAYAIDLGAVNTGAIVLTVLTGTVALLVWKTWRGKADRLLKVEAELSKALRFRRDFKVFRTALAETKHLAEWHAQPGEIVLGNAAAPVQLLIITNPWCIHCREVHQSVEKIVNHYGEMASICIRFNVNTNDPGSDTSLITARILEIYQEQGAGQCLKALSQLNEGEDNDLWLKSWGSSEHPEPFVDVLKESKYWCAKNDLHFTPQILINGQVYPENYPREDLPYFIEDLHEEADSQPIPAPVERLQQVSP